MVDTNSNFQQHTTYTIEDKANYRNKGQKCKNLALSLSFLKLPRIFVDTECIYYFRASNTNICYLQIIGFIVLRENLYQTANYNSVH